MNKTKELYSSPTTELLVVRFEKNLLTGSDPNAKVNTNMSRGVVYDFEELG